MIIEATATGKTVEEAKEAALAELGASPEYDVNFEVISLPQKKTFGLFGGSPAKVRAYMEVEDKTETKVEKKAEIKVEKPTETKKEAKTEPAEKQNSAVSEEKSERKIGTVTDEQINDVTAYLEKVLTLMGVRDVKTEVVKKEDGIVINIDGAKLGVAIGRKGDTIDAIQHLASLVANKGKDTYVRVTLNPGGYREKREVTLAGVAKKSAEQAIRTNRNVILEPMNSYERRIIHNTVQDIDGVTSWSIGEDNHRRVCIGTSKDNKPYRQGYERRGGRNQGRRNDRYNRPDYTVKSEKKREPIKDGENLPLYGVINK